MVSAVAPHVRHRSTTISPPVRVTSVLAVAPIIWRDFHGRERRRTKRDERVLEDSPVSLLKFAGHP